MAKPLKPTESIVSDICTRIMEGQSLVKICNEKNLPSYRTIMRWARDDESFRQSYARARQDQGHAIYAEIQDIEDKVATGEMHPNQGRVLIESKRWRTARMHGKYNEKIVVQQDTKTDINITWGMPETEPSKDTESGDK